MLTKGLRKLSVSKRQALNLASCSFTQAPHVQGESVTSTEQTDTTWQPRWKTG